MQVIEVICYCLVPKEDYSTYAPTYINTEMYNMLHFSTLPNLLPAHLREKNSNSWEFVPFLKKNINTEVSCISSVLFMLRMRKVIKSLKNLFVDTHPYLKQKLSMIQRIWTVYFTSIFIYDTFCTFLLTVWYGSQSYKLLSTTW